MKAILIAIVMILPYTVFCQIKGDDYKIYSRYLTELQHEKKEKVTYVIRDSTCYSDESNISDFLKGFRGFLKGEKGSEGVFLGFNYFRDTLKKDTLWLPLIEQLTQKLNREGVENKFSKKLRVSILNSQDYSAYFGERNYIDQGWTLFQKDHPGRSYLTEFSKIMSDGKRAVFYFSTSFGSLGGSGCLVLFYKDGVDWEFVGTIPLWLS
jgi:hypothetical protein